MSHTKFIRTFDHERFNQDGRLDWCDRDVLTEHVPDLRPDLTEEKLIVVKDTEGGGYEHPPEQ